jgi:5-aminolevulinate synthase
MGFDYTACLTQALQQIKDEQRYRTFVPLQASPALSPEAFYSDCRVTLWSTNDYLGLGRDGGAIRAMTNTACQSGVGAGGTRNIAGTHPLHEKLEQKLTELHGKERALLFGSGYAANEWSLFALARHLPDCVFFSDADNHASLIAGIRASGTQKHIFQHNDLTHLRHLLEQTPAEVPKVIVCESVYSMSGDHAPLEALAKLAKFHHALLYVDEVHAVGLYGPKGAGLSAALGTTAATTLIQGTLGKAFGTMGGYIAGNATLVDLIRSTAWGFIFSTALPPPVVAAALHNVKTTMNTPDLREQFWHNVAETRRMLHSAGIPMLKTSTNSNSHILPVMINDSARCKAMADTLLHQHGIYVQPINYPTVPRGTERLRLTPLAGHTPAMIAHLANALKRTWPLQHTPRLPGKTSA